MANKHYNKQTTTSLTDGRKPPRSQSGLRSAKVVMEQPHWPKAMGGAIGHFRGLQGAPVCSPYPEEEGLH